MSTYCKQFFKHLFVVALFSFPIFDYLIGNTRALLFAAGEIIHDSSSLMFMMLLILFANGWAISWTTAPEQVSCPPRRAHRCRPDVNRSWQGGLVLML